LSSCRVTVVDGGEFHPDRIAGYGAEYCVVTGCCCSGLVRPYDVIEVNDLESWVSRMKTYYATAYPVASICAAKLLIKALEMTDLVEKTIIV
jgi:hypothetical protein